MAKKTRVMPVLEAYVAKATTDASMPATNVALARHGGISEVTLYRWRDSDPAVEAVIARLADVRKLRRGVAGAGDVDEEQEDAFDTPRGQRAPFSPFSGQPVEALSQKTRDVMRRARSAAELFAAQSKRRESFSDAPVAMRDLLALVGRLNALASSLGPLEREWRRRLAAGDDRGEVYTLAGQLDLPGTGGEHDPADRESTPAKPEM